MCVIHIFSLTRLTNCPSSTAGGNLSPYAGLPPYPAPEVLPRVLQLLWRLSALHWAPLRWGRRTVGWGFGRINYLYITDPLAPSLFLQASSHPQKSHTVFWHRSWSGVCLRPVVDGTGWYVCLILGFTIWKTFFPEILATFSNTNLY